MSKRKKFGKVHVSRMGYDLSKFYTPPRRKRERTESEAGANKGKAAASATNTDSGRVETGLQALLSVSSLHENKEDCKDEEA